MLVKQIILSTVFAVLASFATVANAGVSGFVDTQINFSSNGANSPTFSVADGAVYFSDKVGTSSVMVDIPFKFLGTGATNAFTLATTKGQAYVSHSYDFGLGWTLGQFDTIYGFEKNDNLDNHFTGQGILYANKGEITHTGLGLDYTNGPVTVKAIVANPHNQGQRNSDNWNFGGTVKFKHDAFYVQAGYLHHKERIGTFGTVGESSMLADFILGWAGNNITADVEVLLKKLAATGATTGVGFGGWFGYTMNSWLLGARFEYGSKLANYSEFGLGVGPGYKFNDKLTCKIDYMLDSTKALAATTTATTTHAATVSAQYKF